MLVKDLMNTQVIHIAPDETAAVAARLLGRYNIGVLPVCTAGGQLRGMLTDRDIVLRCIAAGRAPYQTPVSEILSGHIVSVEPECGTAEAAALMGREQIRRLPVCRGGRLVGMLSLGDLARQNALEASQTLGGICSRLRRR